ncbi:hypothetical protein ANO11243_064810 [Dothideomycetidae sp. 11243]|nr:hypothetical protein ANO11243_064810 [fungal sp. No.11243]
MVMAKYGKSYQDSKTAAVKSFSETLSAIDTVKSNNAQSFELARYTAHVGGITKWYHKTIHINAQQQGFIQFLASCIFVQAFYYGGTLVRSGEKTPGEVITTFLSAMAVYTSLNAINSQMLLLELGRQAGAKMRAILMKKQCDTSNQNPLFHGRTPWDHPVGKIEFHNVTFEYPTRPEISVLQNVSVKIPLHKMSFFVGRSGSGKSTLGQLMTRLYEPTFGKITIGGIDIASLQKTELRQLVLLVEQDTVLFDDTIRKNIELGKMDDQYISSAEMSKAVNFALLRLVLLLELPDNDQTRVGRGGESVSGGQKQRIALARAYMRNPSILILDESTSALDQNSRKLILDAIRTWRQGKTTIIITHDTELIESDDFVYMMDNGVIVDQGYKRYLGDLDNDTSTVDEGPIRPGTSESQHSFGRRSSFNSTKPLLQDSPSFTTADDTLTIEFWKKNTVNCPAPTLANGRSDQRFSIRALDRVRPRSSFYAPQNRFTTSFSNAPWVQDTRMTNVDINDGPLPPVPALVPISSLAQDQYQAYLPRGRSNVMQRASIVLADLLDRTAWQAQHSRKGRDAREQRRGSVQLQDLPSPTTTTSTLRAARVITFQAVFKSIWPALTGKQRALLILAFVLCLLHAVASPLTSLLTSRLIGTYSFDDGSSTLARTYALAIIGVAIADGATLYLQQITFEYVAQSWIDHIRARAAYKILAKPKAFFSDDENSPSKLVEALDRHADLARNILGRVAPLYTIVVTVLAISVSWATVTEWRVSLVTLAFLPVIIGLTRIFSAVSRKWDRKVNEAATAVNTVFVETFSCVRTIKLLTAEHHFLAKASAACKVAYDIGRKRAVATGLLYGVSEAAQTFAQAAVFYYAARLAVYGVSVPSILLVLVMLIMTFAQVSMILGAIPQASLARDSATRVLRVANLAEDSHENEGHAKLVSVGTIEFRNVSFAYPGNAAPKVLRGISLRFPKGEYVALVGASGSGKSSIAKLLLRLYALGADSGDIIISGRSIAQYQVASLRARIALVQQTNPLLAGSIAANIAYGIPGMDISRIRAAAEAAGLSDFIASLPEGYDTLVGGGEGGQGLSGGQQQRLAIARALVREPDVLMLDEATSALDNESVLWIKRNVMQLIRRGREGGRKVTVIAITHDRRMMEDADRVVVLESGSVVEEGTFRGLMDGPGGALKQLLDG